MQQTHNQISTLCVHKFDTSITQHSTNVCKGALNMMNPITKASVVEKLANAVKQRIKHLQRKQYENIVSRSIPPYVVNSECIV